MPFSENWDYSYARSNQEQFFFYIDSHLTSQFNQSINQLINESLTQKITLSAILVFYLDLL